MKKFREVSDIVWVCLKAVITEKTIKEEWIDKKTILTIITIYNSAEDTIEE